MKGMLRNALSMIIVTILSFACSNNSQQTSVISKPHTFRIDLAKSLDEESMVPADSIFSEVSYIPLETKDDAILGPIERVKVVVEGDTIYILDMSRNSVFCFNSKGKLLKLINKEGRGPGEYLSPRDIIVENGNIFLLCDSPNKIYRYDTNMNLLAEISLPFDASAFAKISNLFYVHTRVNSGESKFSIHVINEDGLIVNKYMPFENLALSGSQRSMWVFNDTVYAEFHNDYNVYQLTPNGFRAWASIDFGDANLPKEAMEWGNYGTDKTLDFVKNNKFRSPIGLSKVLINNNYLIVQYSALMTRKALIWNIQTGKKSTQTISNTTMFPVVQGSLFHSLVNNQLYSLTNASRILVSIENGYGQFPPDLKNIKLESNPILTIYSLK